MIQSLHFILNEQVVLEDRLRALKDLGYERQSAAGDPATFTHRGGVLDVWPWGFTFPVRVEFEYDKVESIYSFDASSGSLLEPHKMVVILPVSDRVSTMKFKKLNWNWGEKPVQPFVDIERGDHVVHVSHGIGIFRGTEKFETPNHGLQEHLVIEYHDGEKLYVPFRELNLVQRYVAPGLAAAKIKLSRLGTKGWIKLREKAREGILAYAHDLLEMQAKRESLEGAAFVKDDLEWEKIVSQRFGYELTPDQARAIAEVEEDMKRARPMDRLICGDVGYGKTEVAIRAVLRCLVNGKQAAVLVPTTLLAEQHYETFRERFKDFPVNVEMLSRFQTSKEQSEVVKRMATGKSDVVIGTHRLLSKDIAFEDLGLVVIDEEQRFGVKHKEKLKGLRLLVDVMTMTATPIPRTLYMSLVGGKDMSVVNTPPKKRVPIQTHVVEFDDDVIRNAIKKELDRKGQVFFIHNRVDSIDVIAQKIKRLAPTARIAVAHGQMDPKPLEKIMHEFIHHGLDVLVSTVIVESGIDIPNANTLFVNRADAFGLAELYQLKGRVGRYDREAHAYFLIPKNASLSHESQRRLDAIQRHSHLGSGFSIAMEDLEIRGAGNLLGTQQSGFIMSVGFDLYCRLLKDAIDSLKPEKAGA